MKPAISRKKTASKAASLPPHSIVSAPPRAILRGIMAVTLAAGIACAAGGCVERKLLLRSDPPGANVILNGTDVGATPVDVPFQTYGTFEIIASPPPSAPRYARLRTELPIHAPWWENIPIDFFPEVLWPGTVRDYQVVELKLQPLQSDEAGLQQREDEMRKRMESQGPAPEGAQP